MSDEIVFRYQESNDGTELYQAYEKFIDKYTRLFWRGELDLSNYGIRRLLSCYIPDEEIRNGLIRGKYRSKESIAAAHKVLHQIRRVFRKCSKEDIRSEMCMILLDCARNYEKKQSTFSSYLYVCFRYKLKKLIDERLFDSREWDSYSDLDSVDETSIIDESAFVDNRFEMPVDEDGPLANDLLWLQGERGTIFKDLTYAERYVLVQAFEKKLTDKQIAQLTGYHEVSINRMKMRLVNRFRDMRARGELKWVR